VTSFIDELMEEIEEKERDRKLDLDRLKADQLLMAVGKLESQMEDVNSLADDEIKLIEHYRQSEIERLNKKRSWLLFNLENFWRQQSEHTGEKTLHLPHGTLSLLKGRDRIEIEDMDLFLTIAPQYGFLRTTPEQSHPDLAAITAWVKRTGEIPLGTKLISSGVRFCYELTKGEPNNGSRE